MTQHLEQQAGPVPTTAAVRALAEEIANANIPDSKVSVTEAQGQHLLELTVGNAVVGTAILQPCGRAEVECSLKDALATLMHLLEKSGIHEGTGGRGKAWPFIRAFLSPSSEGAHIMGYIVEGEIVRIVQASLSRLGRIQRQSAEPHAAVILRRARGLSKREGADMHKVIFYPVGNGDTSQIILANGKRILMDYHHLAKSEDGKGPEINLKEQLKKELADAKKKSFDVVAFTHGDADHIGNSTEFFELQHAQKYQGGGRIPVPELWVPAAMVLEETTCDGRSSEFVIWRQEARHRLRQGSGIRVFSKPEKLKSWFDENKIPLDSRRHLITDAGQTVPGFTLDSDGIEFFCHSPFIKHVDGGDDMRNPCALIFNVRFKVESATFDYLAVGDSEWEVLGDIVTTTRAHENDGRLEWDLYNIPHHCSYRALSDEKGERETIPKPLVADLLRAGRQNAYLVSSSKPVEDSDEARKSSQPPHIQARKCYEQYLKDIGGAKFFVTMEEPSTARPEPLVFNIGAGGITREKKVQSAPAIIVSSPAPRAG